MAFGTSAASLAAQARRRAHALRIEVEQKWFIDRVLSKVNTTLTTRVQLATEVIRFKVVKNISRPVTKTPGPKGGTKVTDRSKPGEFPKADTTQLRKTIFADFRMEGGQPTGYIGTPLDYGLELETRRDRSFLVRTLREEKRLFERIVTRPIT